MTISENGVSFFGAGGHSHNGVNSTIIDVGSYSLFDFSLGYVGSQSRINRQSTNQTAMEEWIIRIVNSKVLTPAGLNMAPNTLNGKIIRADTITATQIQANTITANELSSNIVLINNVIRSNNYDGTIAANGVITTEGTAGWAITSAGDAEFSSASIRGAITANSVSTPGIDILANGAIVSTNFNVTADGNLTATGANISGTITSSLGTIGGWLINDGSITNTSEGSPGYNQFIELSPADGFYSQKYTGSIWGAGFYTTVKINYSTTAGIDVEGTASGNYKITEIRSSYVDSEKVFVNDLQSNSTVTVGNPLNLAANTTVDSQGVYIASGVIGIARPGNNIVLNATAAGNASVQVAEFRRRGVQPGSSGIYVSNTAVAYSTTSDYRLKTNIKIIPKSIEILDQLKPVIFDWKNGGGDNVYGFLAHELQEVVPYAVMGEKDGKDEDGTDKYQSVDVSFVVPILTGALKEAVSRIEQLEARLQALEGV